MLSTHHQKNHLEDYFRIKKIKNNKTITCKYFMVNKIQYKKKGLFETLDALDLLVIMSLLFILLEKKITDMFN